MKGLTKDEVIQSRRTHGSNDLTPPVRMKWYKMLLGKFNDPIIKLLLFATVLSFISGYFHGSLTESIGILLAIFLATFLSFINEYKASKEFDILNQISDTVPVKVLRDCKVMEIPKTEIVVGDIVFLEQGDEIPADGDILEAMNLSVNESTLNGESVPARKHAGLPENDASVDDSSDTLKSRPEGQESDAGAYPLTKVFRGTTVMEGTGTIRIFSVGDNTEIGKTARQAAELTGEETPLNKQLGKLGKLIGRIGFTVAGVTFLALIIRGLIIGEVTLELTLANFEVLLSFFMIAVTLIVVAVPEGLAMSVTLSLAYSMRRMTAGNTLVRKMHACETMGATTVICTDKTGTLTQNRMKVQYCTVPVEPHFVEQIAANSTAHLSLGAKSEAESPENGGVTGKSSDGYVSENGSENGLSGDDVKIVEAPNVRFTEKIEVVGNATEGAMLLLVRESGYDYREYRAAERLMARLPFSTERKFMASLVDSQFVESEHSSEYSLYIKGAAEIVLEMCTSACEGSFDKAAIAAQIKEYQGKGMRILAFANGFVSKNTFDKESENGEEGLSTDEFSEMIASTPLRFVGFMAIADPIRTDVPAAMKACNDAGIEVKIVTGDNSLTAKEIARQSGLWEEEDTDDAIITGSEFAALSDDEAYTAALRIKVMSRARPADKMRLVKLLQKADKVVAVTGDGTNDAPALNHANVGLAMGTGTAVAKEASDIVLLDDSFASIITAVQWGRSIYLNIQRFIQFQLTINVVALLTALLGPFIGIEFPLTVTQMLWVNLIMDTFAALALATEPSDPEVLKNKPRGVNDFIITKRMFSNICIQGASFLAVVIAMMIFFLKYSEGAGPDAQLKFAFTTWIKDLQGLGSHELSMFFTAFVMMQFWNLFNVRVSGTNHSAFHHFFKNKSFLFIVVLILVLQIIIVQLGGGFFRTEPLTLEEWLVIICSTSLILWVGEIVRAIRKFKTKK
ncbi:MAG: cation-translocating P-type ATPase [Bacteroidales bacterium]|nr:cation-translocating P-type ATPase [Bacteroidales bacterium]MDD4670831.1 cation-translocating P-type ATPase [Bacteroidales bacterium]